MVHPDFQKMGLGTALTRHANAIADASLVRTWVPARPTSYKLFLNEGFVVKGVVDSHMERWGGSKELSLTRFLCREPPA